MKKFLKRLIVPLNIVGIVILGLYSLFVAIPRARVYEIYSAPEVETKIYTVWHVETFEGGGKARVDYLKAVARKIEAENTGVLIMVKTIDPARLEDELEAGQPNIISFGYGVGDIVLPYLKTLDNAYSVRDELVKSGMFNNTLYALPFIVSGYAMITHGSLTENFHCGSEWTNPNMIYERMNLTPVEQESQYEAYKDFVNDKTSTLLGTARDVFRVNNLNAIGRTTAIITPVDSYTDLIQYLGLIKSDEITNQFLSLAESEEFQLSLTDYSLFSSTLNLYSSGLYADMENAILNCEVARVFG